MLKTQINIHGFLQVCLKSKSLQIIDFAGCITFSLSQLTEAGGLPGTKFEPVYG